MSRFFARRIDSTAHVLGDENRDELLAPKEGIYYVYILLVPQIHIKLTLCPKIRIAMANNKAVSTNVQSNDLQDDTAQETIT